MRYAYYPGCSLTTSSVEYDAATRAVLARLGVELADIPDWTCCGASAVEAVSRLLSFALPARNLALAERDLAGADVLIPCSACYLNHRRVQEHIPRDKALTESVNEALSDEALTYAGTAKVRHLLDVLATDIGADPVAEAVSRPLEGISVAPYYGCQALRPYADFDCPERPTTMEPLLSALGATVHEWNLGGACCGASLMATKKEAALVSVAALLGAAQGADVIATVCPMCQMNLEAYQSEALGLLQGAHPVSVVYLPQLMGLAMGMREADVLLGKNLTVTEAFLRKIRSRETIPA
ncbi:MAG: CoB--CoM heterodisulfide reductase iron-sulfur subunit B family protein [Desulfovibrionaceae bacterium]